MPEMKCRIADLNVLLNLRFDRTINQAKAYLIDENTDEYKNFKEDISITVTDELIKNKQENDLKYCTGEDIEYICTGSMFYRYLLSYSGLLLHSSAVVVDGYAYLFSADSGTGKSTHTGLWLEYFKDRAYILNDDKPALRRGADGWKAYGTPWSGKYDISVNKGVKLGAIVFLERDTTNHIEELASVYAIQKFVAQTTRKLSKEANMNHLLTNLDLLLREVPVYNLGCNISMEAVEVAYNKIRRC